MADQTVVHIGENSPQEVAYKLMKDIMAAEQMTLRTEGTKAGWKTADRAYLLKTYSACIDCVTRHTYSIDKI